MTMRAINYAIFGLFIAACAVMHTAPPEVRQALAPSGKLRIGVYVDSPAIEMLQQRDVDAFATNKPNLFQMSD